MRNARFLWASMLFIAFALTSFSLVEPEATEPREQVKVTVTYGHPTDPAAFEEYYTRTHAPIAAKMKGVTRIELTKFNSGGNGESPAFYRMAELYFPSVEAMEQVMSTKEAQDALNDLPNFVSGGHNYYCGNSRRLPFSAALVA